MVKKTVQQFVTIRTSSLLLFRVWHAHFFLFLVFISHTIINCSIDGRGTTLQAGRSRARLPMRSRFFSGTPNPSSDTMAPRFTQPVTEMSTGRFLGVERCRRVRLTT
jgi:hypothetical protein